MKSITLPSFDASRPASEQFAEHFTRCGLNADWSVDAYHLSDERTTGHKPNAESGDFYLLENEDTGGWDVVIRTLDTDEDTPHAAHHSKHIVEIVAEFSTASEAWEWLQDPVSQQFYLLGTAEELNEARGIEFRGEDVPVIRKGDVLRILPQFQDDGDDKCVWYAADDESKGRVSISPSMPEFFTNPIQTVERRMVQPVTLTKDMLDALKVTDGNIRSLRDSGTMSAATVGP